MRHFTHALAAAYTLASLAMLYCAITSQQNGAPGYCAMFAGCAVLFALAIFHHGYHRDELRFARAQLERTARPPGLSPAKEDAVQLALAEACCEAWWTSAGADHEPTCPNHQHRSAA